MDFISSKAAMISISLLESKVLFSKAFIASPVSSVSRFRFSLSTSYNNNNELVYWEQGKKTAISFKSLKIQKGLLRTSWIENKRKLHLILFTPRFKISGCTELHYIVRILWISLHCELCRALGAFEVKSKYLNAQISLQNEYMFMQWIENITNINERKTIRENINSYLFV